MSCALGGTHQDHNNGEGCSAVLQERSGNNDPYSLHVVMRATGKKIPL